MRSVALPRATRFARRPLAAAVLASSVMLFGATLASAAPALSVKPDSGTWGTGPAPNGRAQLVSAVVEADGRAYLGGKFTKMVAPSGGDRVTRNRLAALDVKRRTLLPWNPNANGAVRAMALNASKTGVYVGGDFSAIGGKWVSKLALVDLRTGKVDGRFRPAVKGRVRALVLAGDRLYVGGDFTRVGSTARAKVAALHPVTGALLDWTPPALGPGRYLGQTGVPTVEASPGHVFGLAVSGDGSRVYVAGTFIDFAGQGGLLVLDAATGAPRPEQWDLGRPLFGLAVWPGDGKTVFAAAGGPGGRIYALHPDRPGKLRWKASVDGDAVGVVANKSHVFLLGHYDYIVPKGSTCYQYCPNGTSRRHLAAFDAVTGALDGWNPRADTSTGPWGAVVTSDHLIVVGEFSTINGRRHPGYAQFGLS